MAKIKEKLETYETEDISFLLCPYEIESLAMPETS